MSDSEDLTNPSQDAVAELLAQLELDSAASKDPWQVLDNVRYVADQTREDANAESEAEEASVIAEALTSWGVDLADPATVRALYIGAVMQWQLIGQFTRCGHKEIVEAHTDRASVRFFRTLNTIVNRIGVRAPRGDESDLQGE